MGSKTCRARPMWMWYFRNAEYCLGKILTTLNTLEPNAMATPELRKWTGIEFNELDIKSGLTSNGSSFFTPRHDETCKISNTGRDPDSVGEDEFTCCRRLGKAGINRHSGLQMDAAFAFRDYARDLADVYQLHDEWEYIPGKSDLKGQFSSSRNSPHGFDVFRGSQITSTRQCHRSVWMASHNSADANWPSVSELIMLVS
ncbi:hypothetical protein N7481_012973 [Penicillium waksmanii]|uniref:uncharacterized protein n=1 Tax=Penicillium waksmanii TaxID=69791 RepID=UPI002549B5B6|nr:uncharacterized protein N7481_012973 [Penicillium waksmanii]KAJ5966259.1 hypothetical protein N7481_012973 [Penicillium waksmanii]